uniref:Uncharacterized protein n=1 Tax=Rhabditophanes sp. KR3021 TaxID=114890 RepID=A0AC35UAH4_9BILA
MADKKKVVLVKKREEVIFNHPKESTIHGEEKVPRSNNTSLTITRNRITDGGDDMLVHENAAALPNGDEVVGGKFKAYYIVISILSQPEGGEHLFDFYQMRS